jgi:hypothetical protein
MADKIELDARGIKEINTFFNESGSRLAERVRNVLEKYGTVPEINAKAAEAGRLDSLLARLKESNSPFLDDIGWLLEQREEQTFISMNEYRRRVSGGRADSMTFTEKNAVTLEISPLQYFPWLMREARQALEQGELMPARFIRLRKMKEQEEDGELIAVTAAMKVLGASCVESPETSGADGSNVHLGGPDTMAGYYGGIGAPNDYPLKWLDEILYYYTNFGVNEFINVSYGTMFTAMLAYQMGINIGIKISVTMGHDNPYHIFWTLMTGKLFQRCDGSTVLVGLNFSNSVNTETILQSNDLRRGLAFEEMVRFEHHITEPYLGVVRQPYLRRDQLLEIAASVPNISAKHEGGEPDVEAGREHPSNHLENFRCRQEIIDSGDMPKMERNYMDKHAALNTTARALTEKGLSFIAAPNLHRREL